jgi:hypothetical protein
MSGEPKLTELETLRRAQEELTGEVYTLREILLQIHRLAAKPIGRDPQDAAALMAYAAGAIYVLSAQALGLNISQ